MLDKLTPEEKKQFWIRFGLFISIGFLAPIIYLIIRYNLFQPSSGIQIGLWGLIVFGILISLIGTLIYFYLQAMKSKYSLLKQCLSGLCKVIFPMALAALILSWFRDNISLVIEALWVFVGCEAVAIPINPLPKVAFYENLDGFSDIISGIYKRVKNGDEPTPTPTPEENTSK